MKKEEKERLFNEIFNTFRQAYLEGLVSPIQPEIERHWKISCRKFGLDPEDKDLLFQYLDYCIARLRRLSRDFQEVIE